MTEDAGECGDGLRIDGPWGTWTLQLMNLTIRTSSNVHWSFKKIFSLRSFNEIATTVLEKCIITIIVYSSIFHYIYIKYLHIFTGYRTFHCITTYYIYIIYIPIWGALRSSTSDSRWANARWLRRRTCPGLLKALETFARVGHLGHGIIMASWYNSGKRPQTVWGEWEDSVG